MVQYRQTPPAARRNEEERMGSVDGEQIVQLLWEYYRAAAEIRGRGKERRTEEGEVRPMQGNYSLLWFYIRSPERLNALSRAFLGDGAAMERLDWDAAPPEGWEASLLEGRPLNEFQLGAVRAALAAPLSFIQGPPGTGKTETILNLACCAARLGEGRSVAIVSSNGSALDNIEKKIEEIGEELETRRGQGGADQPNRRWLTRHFARLGSLYIRKNFQDPRPEEEPAFQFKGTSVKIPWDGGQLSVGRERSILAEEFLGKYPIVASTIHSLKNCFKNGPEYLYDYVIMDESSQTDAVAGLVAMSCARHLVLVGDPKQLPPVIPEAFVQELAETAAERGWEVPPDHAAAPERSFLDVCLDVFGGRTAQTTLRRHYRCHPGIIGFCAKNVYQEEQLEICTPQWDQSVPMPIRVLWFEGDYCERYCFPPRGGEGGERDKARWSKHNRKQLLCFMEEEWPRLWERIAASKKADGGPLSVCILSPFKGQLASLQKAILADIAARHQSAEEVELSLEEDAATQKGELEQGPPMLTIHKSQGREFDIVYLLPVEDGDWEWPWSQQKRLINVAVSRAKKELRLVLSSVLMEEEIQAELTGRPVPPRRGDGDAAPGAERDQRFLQKLVRYVREEYRAVEEKTGLAGYPAAPRDYEFGFHRSARPSVFDREPWFRASQPEKAGGKMSAWAPELCLETALVRVLEAYWTRRGVRLSLYRDVPLRDVRDAYGRPVAPPWEQEAMRNLIWRGGHLDFVLCRGDRILLAVEVDGGYHRLAGQEGEDRRERDEAKNRLLQDVMGAACFMDNARRGGTDGSEGSFAFLRLPNDGGTCLETRELWQEGAPDQKARYFPLEELLDAQLNKADGGGAYYVPAKGIAALVSAWDPPEGTKNRAVQAVRQLMEKNLLVKRPYLALEGSGKPSAAPTEEGKKQGIIAAIQLNIQEKRNGETEHTIYGNALYPKTAQENVLKLLNGYVPLTANMTVYELLSAVYAPFKEYLQGLGSAERQVEALAGLNGLISFQGDGMDYTRDEAQEMYILRYLYGYAYEYKQMYLRLLDQMERPAEWLSVTSIGCGNMVDYWSLRAALARRPGVVAKVNYTGVDINSWSRRFQIRPDQWDRAEFVQADAAVWLREQAAAGASPSDVYMFPKSIGEFDGRWTVGGEGSVLQGIRDGLRDLLRGSGKDRVWLLISLPKTNEARGKYDEEKCAYLREGLAQAGFHAEGPADQFITDGEVRRISDADPYFAYLGKYVRDMNAYGEYKDRRDPVQNTGHERYQVLLFRRGG